MKEVHVDEMVLTQRGRIRLGDVVVGDKILTHRGRFREVEKIADKGVQPTLVVTTANGRQVRAEPSHPFLTTRGWIPAADLQVGDILAAVSPIEEGMRALVSPEEARLLGYLVGDGSLTNSPSFTNADGDVLEDFERCAAACGFITGRREPSPSAKAKNAKATLIGLRGSLGWLAKHGLFQKSSYTKRIPPLVLGSDAETIANFIGAYWSCDGMIKIRHKRARGDLHMASCTTVGAELAKDIQHALLRLGIHARLRKKSRPMVTRRQPGGMYHSWDVFSATHGNAVKFRELPGLCPRKKAPLLPLVYQTFDRGPLFEDEIVSIDDGGPGECRCLRVNEDHSFTAGDIAVHNSMLLNVFWPAWEWGPLDRPDYRYVSFSYSSDLTERDNEKFLYLIQSEKYQSLYGNRVSITKDGIGRVSNSKRGWKYASSVGGVGTGERGNRILADDLHKVKEAESETIRVGTCTWFKESMQNRLNNLGRDAIVVLGQRVHESDVSGLILDEYPDYVHFNVPMEFEKDRRCVTSLGWSDPRTEDGELAWEERYPESVLHPFRAHPFLWAGQYQQRPEPRGGGIIKREWWQTWVEDAFPPMDYVLASLDTAYTTKQENDYSALTVWGVFSTDGKAAATNMVNRYGTATQIERVYREGPPNVMLMMAWQKRLEFPELVIETVKTCRKFKVDKLIIENTAAGKPLEAELRRSLSAGEFMVQLITPHGDKTARMYAVQTVFAPATKIDPLTNKEVTVRYGLVWAPDREWADMVINQVATFPKGTHDDIPDTVSQGLKHLRDCGLLQMAEERLAEIEESKIWHGSAPQPLYPS
jgi:predicted phage terminase large subunit-like protein